MRNPMYGHIKNVWVFVSFVSNASKLHIHSPPHKIQKWIKKKLWRNPNSQLQNSERNLYKDNFITIHIA